MPVIKDETTTRDFQERRDMARIAADTVQEIIWIVDSDNYCHYINREGERFFGCSAAELIGTQLRHHPKSARHCPPELDLLERDVLDTRQSRELRRIKTTDASGNMQFLDMFLSPIDIQIDGKSRACILGIGHYVTELVAESWRASNTQQMLERVVERSPMVIWAVDTEGRFTLSTGMGLTALGLKPGEVIGRSALEMYGAQSDMVTAIRAALAGEAQTWDSNSSGIWHNTHASPLHDDDGRIVGVLGVSVDISERLEQEQRLLQLAYHSAVADLPNRARFVEWLSDVQEQKLTAAIVHFDLDRFGRINESFGRDLGDRLIEAAGERLREVLPASARLAHMGADHFAALLLEGRTEEEAHQTAESALNAFRIALELEEGEFFCSMSAGIALIGDDSPDDWLNRAEIALNHAKTNGRNRCLVFHESFIADIREDTRVYMELRKALELKLLEVHYEPQISLRNRRIIGFEALTRWRHPPLASVPVARTIRVAEEAGLIREITRLVLEQVSQHLQQWRARLGTQVPCVSINVNSTEFVDPSFLALVTQMLESQSIPASSLRIELTESAMMERPEAARKVLLALRDRGVMASLDDFGTGFSSLSLLHELPVEELKIDRSFVPGPGNPVPASLLRTIMAMATLLRLRTTVEGVETREQEQLVTALGCDHAQGWLYSRALNAEAALELAATFPSRFSNPPQGQT